MVVISVPLHAQLNVLRCLQVFTPSETRDAVTLGTSAFISLSLLNSSSCCRWANACWSFLESVGRGWARLLGAEHGRQEINTVTGKG
jgi:hypothetical protein